MWMAKPDFCISSLIFKYLQREERNLKKFWETEKAKSQKAFTQEWSSRIKTGRGGEEKIIDTSNPEVWSIKRKPQIVEWSNLNDSDSITIENAITNSKF